MNRTITLGLVTALAACGRIGFDPTAAGDASSDAVVDVATDARLGTWNPPTAVALPTVASDDDPSLTGDLLEVIFNRGANQIFSATRTAVGQPWSTPVLVSELSASTETVPELFEDGLGIYFGSDRAGGLGGIDIWSAARATRSSAWTSFTPRVELNSTANEFTGRPTPDGLELVMSNDASGSEDLLISVRASVGIAFPTPQRIPALATADMEGEGFLSSNGLALYYTGPAQDLYVSRRTNRTEQFGVGTPIAELNSASEERDAWVSADERYIMFSSTRGGSRRLYEATR